MTCWRLPLLLSVALALVGCARTDHHRAPAHAVQIRSTGPNAIAGDYVGTWRSHSGHQGKLLCTLSQTGPEEYRAHFTAYWLAFHSSYDVLLRAHRAGRELRFSGEKDLGKIYGGRYRYVGHCADGVFHADYSSVADSGSFQLTKAVADVSR